MSSKTLIRFRTGITLFLYLLVYLEYIIVYPSRNTISSIVPFITVMGIIICIAILMGIESIILDFESMGKYSSISYFYQSLTVLFLVIVTLPEVVYTYLSTTAININFCIITIFHFVMLQVQNRNIVNTKINLYRKSLEIERKYNNISDTLYYKYSDFLLKINIMYIFVYSFNSLIIRRCITFIYACFIIYIYYKMKNNSKIEKFYKQKKHLYELCYKLFSLLLIFIFSKYLNGLLAVVIIAMITLPTRNNISNLLRKNN